MDTRYFKTILFLFAAMLMAAFSAFGQKAVDEGHIRVSLRMIGHQMLLHSRDSTSRVLPIEKEADRYKLQFETPFQFDPEDLVATIDSVVRQTGIAHSYLVEVEACTSREVVYSYEVGAYAKQDVVPCSGRVQPMGCYILMFTILSEGPSLGSTATAGVESQNPSQGTPPETRQESRSVILWLAVPALLLIGWFGFFRNKEKKPEPDPQLIPIGAFRFDKRNMELLYENEKTELTSKEADLLYLLYTSANETLERDRILHSVWGDEGDYIGRTLDVFISKLRKKLEADASIKIVNARGVGYRLVVNGVS